MQVLSSVERTLTQLDHARLTRLLGKSNEMLAGSDLVPSQAVPPDVVTMYSQVLLADAAGGEPRKLVLCYPQDAEPASGFVSVLSPVGASLLGLRVGNVARWRMPDGTQGEAEIRALLFQPEASGDYTT